MISLSKIILEIKRVNRIPLTKNIRGVLIWQPDPHYLNFAIYPSSSYLGHYYIDTMGSQNNIDKIEFELKKLGVPYFENGQIYVEDIYFNISKED